MMLCGIHDESGALGHAFLRVENAERGAQFALHVGQHGEGQVPQVGVVGPPGVVHEFAIRAAAQDLGIAILKFLFSLPKAAISVGHTKVKSFGQKK